MKKICWAVLLTVLVCLGGCAEGNINTAGAEPPARIEMPPVRRPPAEIAAPDNKLKNIEQTTGDLTLRHALALVLVHNPELKSSSWQIRISEANQLGASLRPNPEVEFEAEQLGASEGTETTVRLSQLIEMGDKRRKRIRVASLGRDLAAMDYEARRLDVLTQVDKSFIDVLAARQQLELTGQFVSLSTRALDAVDARVRAGKDSPIEKTRAEIALSNVRIKSAQAKQDLDAARRNLARLWGSDKPVFEKAVGKLDKVAPVPSPEALADLIGNNPDLARWVVEIEQRRAAFDLAKAKGKSDITLSGGVQYLEGSAETAMVVGVSLPLPFFDVNQGGRMRAANRLAQANEQQKAAEMRINIALTRAHQALSNAFIKTTELKNNVLQNAQTLLDAATEGYKQGKFDYLHVLDAQRTYFEARLQHLESLAACHKARADVERLIGQSLENVNQTPETKQPSPKPGKEETK